MDNPRNFSRHKRAIHQSQNQRQMETCLRVLQRGNSSLIIITYFLQLTILLTYHNLIILLSNIDHCYRYHDISSITYSSTCPFFGLLADIPSFLYTVSI